MYAKCVQLFSDVIPINLKQHAFDLFILVSSTRLTIQPNLTKPVTSARKDSSRDSKNLGSCGSTEPNRTIQVRPSSTIPMPVAKGAALDSSRLRTR